MEQSTNPEQQLLKALNRTIEAGYQVDADTLKTMRKLAQLNVLEKMLEEALNKASKQSQKPLFLPGSLLEPPEQAPFPQNQEAVFDKQENYAEQIEARVEILDNPGKEAIVTKDPAALMQYFRDRLARVSSIMRQRSDARNIITVEDALKATLRTKNKIICMLTDRRETKKALFLTVEDTTSRAAVLVSNSRDPTLPEKARSLFLDQVFCMEISRIQNDLLVASEIINPDIPDIPPKLSDEEVYAALISDIHVGSNKFLSEPFQQFLKWVRGETSQPSLRTAANRLKYVVIAGDLVDGIGVYPGQEKELSIKDIHQQYSEAAKLLSQIPEHIQIILIPGNHDATLEALPQPPIPDQYAKPLFSRGNITNLGDPATVKLHGVEVLIYHGQSLNDTIGTIPGVTYQNLEENIGLTMRSLLKARHLAPIYGGRTPIIPQATDHLVIQRPPAILHCGHVHITGYEKYRGSLLVNSGAWQSQTEYQERMGVVPNPGTAVIVNLRNLNTQTLDCL